MKKVSYFLVCVLIFISTFSFGQYNKRYIYAKSQNSIVNKQYYDAISLLTLLIESDSISRDAYFLRAIAKYNLNDLIGAEQDFTSAIKINPVYVEAYQYRAITRSIMGNWDDAVIDFEKAISIRPDYTDIYYSRGVTFLMCQQFDNAVKDFNVFIKTNPEEEDAYLNRGSAYLMLKDTLSAFNDINKAVEVASRSSEALTRRAGIYAMMNKKEEAFEDYSKAIFYDNKNLTAYFNRAILESQSNRPMDAIADFTRVIELDPSNSLSYFNRAITKSQIGDFNSAMSDYDKVVELSPDNVLGYYNRAGLALKLGDLEKSVNDYSYTIELYPDFANAYLGRAAVRYDIGDMVGSKSDKETADLKIAEYRSKFGGSAAGEQFSIYADTSRQFNRMLAFDSKYGDKVKEKNVDIKLLSLFKLLKAGKVTDDMVAMNKMDYAANKILEQMSIKNLIISNEPVDMSRDEIIEERAKRGKSKDFKEPWMVYLEDAISSYSIKQYTSAISDLNQAILKNQNNPFLYMTRSSVSCEMMEFIQSIGTSGQKFVIDSDKSKELKATNQVTDFKNSLYDINYAITLNPKISFFYYNRANIHVLMGDMPSAIADYTKAIELEGTFAQAYYNRGLVQIYIKENKKGFLDLSRAGELGIKSAYDVIERYMGEK